uniref:Baculoviral IAP repeat containing 5b n=2 Tax=Neolamprologus brichardi TaxID=32507 RepID=A0A3Q4HUK7_NEOBR
NRKMFSCHSRYSTTKITYQHHLQYGLSCFLHLQMAKAGFVHCPSENEPDVACCFFCLLELEGWEPDDDPWSEHERRSKCGFLTMKKDFTKLTMAEFCHLEKKRLKIYYKKVCHKKMAFLRDAIDHTLEVLKSQLD